MIEEKKFSDANSLWKFLSTHGQEYDIESEILYRGHANVEWKLVPIILRLNHPI